MIYEPVVMSFLMMAAGSVVLQSEEFEN